MEFFKIRRDIPFMKNALVFNVISLVTFLAAVFFLVTRGLHLSVERSGANYVARVQDGDPVNRHKPSVEVLFGSAARVVGPNALGVMLTGMGADGAQAMRAMRDAGSYNICQDEASCVVFGMPREAIHAGAADEIVPLQAMARRLLARLAGHRHVSASA